MKWLTKTIVYVFLLSSSIVSVKAQKASSELLTPDNHALVMIDYEGQMAFATSSININLLRNNTAVVAGASKIFNIPLAAEECMSSGCQMIITLFLLSNGFNESFLMISRLSSREMKACLSSPP